LWGDDPVKGLSFEEALKRWSSPERYAAMVDLKNPTEWTAFGIKGFAERQRKYRHVREELEDALFDLLRRGEVLSSADNPAGDPDHPRVLVDPEVYTDGRLSYHPEGECIEGSNFELRAVQVFSRNRVPAGLPQTLYRPEQLNANSSMAYGRKEAETPPSAKAFRADLTYEHVWIGEQEFSLTRLQAAIVRELHRAALDGHPWVSRERLREAVEFESEKLSHLFRRMPNWRELIRSDRRGNYRLNVRPGGTV
jgi:hypothetical protein